LAQLYQDQSLMTYQGDKVQGRANILKKLAELPIRTVKHDIHKKQITSSSPTKHSHNFFTYK
jgi:hypothetical protein